MQTFCRLTNGSSSVPNLKAQMISTTLELLDAICGELNENTEGDIAELIDLVAIVGEIDMEQSPNRQILAEIDLEYEDEPALLAA